MNLSRWRNRFQLYRGLLAPILVLLAIPFMIFGLIIEWWWFALAVFATLSVIAIFNYRDFILMSKIGGGFRALKEARFADAETILREALEMAKSRSPDDPRLVIIYQDLGQAMRRLGNYTDAEEFGKLSIAICEKVWGTDGTDYLIAAHLLAETYVEIARYAEAEPLLNHILQVRESATDVAEIVACLNLLARLCAEQDRHAKAEEYYRRAFDLIEQSAQQKTVEGLVIALNLVQVYAEQDKFSEAEAMAQTAFERIQSETPPDAFHVAFAMYQIARIRLRQQRFPEAEEVARRALALVEKTLEPGHPSMAMFLNLVATTQAGQNKWQEAEGFSRKALQLREEYLAPEHPFVAESLEILALILESQGRMHEAEGYSHRAAQIREFHSPLRIVG